MGEAQSTCRPQSVFRCNKDKDAFPTDALIGPDARSTYDVGGLEPTSPAKMDARSSTSSGLAIEAAASPLKRASVQPLDRVSITSMSSSSTPLKRTDRRQDTMTRGSTWLAKQLKLNDPHASACEIIRNMLEEDELGPGQRADLEYVERVLVDLRHRGDQVDEKVKVNVDTMEQDVNVDDTTLEYLKTFADSGPKRRHKTFREVAQAVFFAQSLRKFASATTIRGGTADLILNSESRLLKALEEIDSWNKFDIFHVASLASSAVLEYVGLMAIQRHGLWQFNISLPKLRVFLAEIEQQYLANPYHNSLHAADVVQTVHNLIRAAPESSFSEIEKMTSLFAAMCHDVGHGGVTNNFRVASLDEGALTYNDISVNEHMHCSITYRTLLRDECNWLDGLTREQALSVRKMFIDMVLATDMQFHFAKLQTVNRLFEEKGNEIYKWESSSPILELLVHGADISNPTKPHHIAMKWTERVLEEFFAQGDEERRLGRTCSPLCERESVSKAGSQNGFIEFIVQPTIEALSKLCELKVAITNLKEYHAFWQREIQEEKDAAEVLPSNTMKSEKLSKITGHDRVKNLKERRPQSTVAQLVPPVRGQRKGK